MSRISASTHGTEALSTFKSDLSSFALQLPVSSNEPGEERANGEARSFQNWGQEERDRVDCPLFPFSVRHRATGCPPASPSSVTDTDSLRVFSLDQVR